MTAAPDVFAPSTRKKTSPVAVAICAVAAIVAAWIVSFAYGPAEHYSPLIYLNIVLAGAFGWLIGAVGRVFLKKYRVKEKSAAIVVGLAGGLFGVWFAWLSYLWVITDYDFSVYLEVLRSPGDLWYIFQAIADNPMWAVGKSSGSEGAWFYYAVWIGEVVVVVGMAVKTCLDFVNNNTLCKACDDWVIPTGDLALFAVPSEDPQAVIDAVTAGDLSGLAALPKLGGGQAPDEWFEANGFACPNCQESECFVTVKKVEMKKGKKKKELERTETKLVVHAPVSAEVEEALFGTPEPAVPSATSPEAPPPSPGPGE